VADEVVKQYTRSGSSVLVSLESR